MLSKWIGWLGLIVVAVAVVLVTIVSGVFHIVRPSWLWSVATGTALLWKVAVGVALLRLKEPVAPDSSA